MSCSCRGAFWRSLPSFCVAGQHFRRFGLVALHSPLYAPQSTLNTLYTPQYTLHTLYFKLYTLHSRPPHYTLTLHTLYSPLHTLFPLCTPNLALHILHCTLHIFSLYNPHFTPRTFHIIINTRTPYFTLYALHSTRYAQHFTLHPRHTPHSTLQHSSICAPHCTLRTTLYTLHYTLHTQYFLFTL